MTRFIGDTQKVFLDTETGDFLLSNTDIASPVVGYVHNQNIASNKWEIFHEEGTDILLISIYEKLSDGTMERVKSDDIKINDVNRIEVSFSNAISGIASLFLIRKSDWLLPLEIPPSPTPSLTFTPTNTRTPTFTPTNTVTPTVTVTNTNTPTNTTTPTTTKTPTLTPTPSLTPTNTPTNNLDVTPSITPTNTVTPSITITTTPTNTPTPTLTPTLAILSMLKLAGSGTNNGGNGSFNWTDSNNISSDDDNFAFINPSSTENNNSYLRASNFNFNIPEFATILGIEVTYNRYTSLSGGNNIFDNVIQLVVNGLRAGDNLSTGDTWTTVTTTLKKYGDPTELWGLNWTPVDINSNNFGVDLRIDTNGTRLAQVDYVSIKVYYSV